MRICLTLRCDLDDVRRHGVLHGNQGVKERIAGVSVSNCAGELENSNGRFGDVVAQNLILVALDKDGSLTAIGNVIAAGKVVVTGQINPNENQGIGDIVGLDFGVLPACEDADLVCGHGVVFDAHIIGLKDQYAGGVKRAVCERNAGRPHVVCDGIVQDAALCAEADLNAVLRGAGCGTKARDNVVGDGDFRARFIAGDSVLLIVVDAVVVDADFGGSAAEALHDDGITALAAIERKGEFGVTHGVVFDTAR
jgi:hypothetical protein